jgi:glycosyltransferase involved in cell wall biosynthesis
MLSFVVPAHNEQALIGRTLSSINITAQLLGEPYEIVVADDASTDHTSAIAKEHGARVITVDKRQIAAVRNAGARKARGQYLLFVDADTVVTTEVVREAVRAMREGAVGGGCAVEFDGEIPLYAAVLHPVLNWLFRVTGFACGCFLFCTREAFEATGGFNEEFFASEELSMSKHLKRVGRFKVLRENVITSGRKLRSYSGVEVFRMFGGFILRGPESVKSRDGLDLWYGERRPDPETAPQDLLREAEFTELAAPVDLQPSLFVD